MKRRWRLRPCTLTIRTSQLPYCLAKPQPNFSRILLFGLQQGVHDLKIGKAEDLSIAHDPHFVVPFPPDPDFVNRSDIWTWMEMQYAGPGIRFALVGFGGFGYVALAAYKNLH